VIWEMKNEKEPGKKTQAICEHFIRQDENGETLCGKPATVVVEGSDGNLYLLCEEHLQQWIELDVNFRIVEEV